MGTRHLPLPFGHQDIWKPVWFKIYIMQLEAWSMENHIMTELVCFLKWNRNWTHARKAWIKVEEQRCEWSDMQWRLRRLRFQIHSQQVKRWNEERQHRGPPCLSLPDTRGCSLLSHINCVLSELDKRIISEVRLHVYNGALSEWDVVAQWFVRCLASRGSHVRIPLQPLLRDIGQVLHSQLPEALGRVNSDTVSTLYLGAHIHVHVSSSGLEKALQKYQEWMNELNSAPTSLNASNWLPGSRL